MKRIQYKGRTYLVSSPKLCNGGPHYTCIAWTTQVRQDNNGIKQTYPKSMVTGPLSLNDLAKIFMDGFGISIN